MYKNRRVAVIIAAGGTGTRMNADIPKQFMRLCGKTVLARSIELFQNNFADSVTIVVHPMYIELAKSIASGYTAPSVLVTEGGTTRQASVYAGLKTLTDDTDVVVIHDAARPLLRTERLAECLEACLISRAAILGTRPRDTIKIAENHNITTPARENLFAAATPQVFDYELIKSAHSRAEAEGFLGTDDANLVERMGITPTLIYGDYSNIKITDTMDFAYAESVLNQASDNF